MSKRYFSISHFNTKQSLKDLRDLKDFVISNRKIILQDLLNMGKNSKYIEISFIYDQLIGKEDEINVNSINQEINSIKEEVKKIKKKREYYAVTFPTTACIITFIWNINIFNKYKIFSLFIFSIIITFIIIELFLFCTEKKKDKGILRQYDFLNRQKRQFDFLIYLVKAIKNNDFGYPTNEDTKKFILKIYNIFSR